MAKYDSNAIRNEEREVETRAAFAGQGDSGGSGGYSMPGTTRDTSVDMCQAAADAARSFNAGEEENAGSGTSEMQESD